MSEFASGDLIRLVTCLRGLLLSTLFGTFAMSSFVMKQPRSKSQRQAPPQLIGILADAVEMGATSFRLEPNLPHTMASFSAGSRAAEIDFEAWSGREMMEYLAEQVTDAENNTGRFVLENGGRQYECQVTLDRRRDPRKAQVAWK